MIRWFTTRWRAVLMCLVFMEIGIAADWGALAVNARLYPPKPHPRLLGTTLIVPYCGRQALPSRERPIAQVRL